MRTIQCACVLVALVCGPFLNGCSTQRAFTYPLEPISVVNRNPPDARIAVLPATDSREHKNRGATVFLYLIPLMPFGWMDYHRPEAASMFNTIREFDATITEDIPKAIAQHLQSAGYAQPVFFDFGANAESADYILETDIRKTLYHGRTFSYGLSVYGPILWFLGLPAGTSDVSLSIDLVMRDNGGSVVWSDRIDQEKGFVQGLYYRWGRDMEPLARALQAGLDGIVRAHPLPMPAE